MFDRVIEDAEEVCIQCGFRNFRKVPHNKQPQHHLEETIPLIAGQVYKQNAKGIDPGPAKKNQYRF